MGYGQRWDDGDTMVGMGQGWDGGRDTDPTLTALNPQPDQDRHLWHERP